MTKKKSDKKEKEKCSYNPTDKCCGGAIYGLGFLGAAIYYVSTAAGFWIGVLGILKALFWPVFLVYEVLKFIGA